MTYLKFDFSDSELEKFPELKKYHDSLYCIRTALIAFGEDPGSSDTVQALALTEETYSALKVPSLDGEELWIVAKKSKSQFEKQIWLKSPLSEVFSFSVEKIKSMLATQPTTKTHLSLTLDPNLSEIIVTGCAISGMSLGKKTIDQLRQSGHLVFTNIK